MIQCIKNLVVTSTSEKMASITSFWTSHSHLLDEFCIWMAKHLNKCQEGLENFIIPSGLQDMCMGGSVLKACLVVVKYVLSNFLTLFRQIFSN